MKPEPISAAAMDVAVSIEKDVPARITGENRVFIRAVIARAISAAVAAEREACFGHIMTVVESLMEGRMTDAGLSKKDHIEMQAQIEALEVVADELQARGRP